MPRVTSGTIEVNGADLYYEISGSGSDVVLGHAGVADSRMWDREFAALSSGYRVVRYDARGYGRSSLPPGPFSRVGDLRGLMQALGIQKPILIGCSMAGSASLDYAVENPDGVAALVLVAPGLDDHSWSAELEAVEEEEDEAFERGDVDGVIDVNLRTWVYGPKRGADAVSDEVRERARSMILDAYAKLKEAAGRDPGPGPVEPLEPRAGSRLDHIRAPTLVIAGTEDVADIHAIADRLEREIPGAEKVTMEGVAHLPNLEKPEEFERILRRFLERLGS